VKLLLIAVVTLVAAVLAWFVRDNNAAFALCLAFASLGVPYLLDVRLEDVPRGMRWSAVLAATVFRWSQIRVSVAYLVRIRVEGRYLLVRGHRITTQFQPVGGVYKVRQDVLDRLREKLGVAADVRFSEDADNAGDLRLMMPGRSLRPFLQWLGQRQEYEAAPWREFFEELVKPGLVRAEAFATPHFEFLGSRSTSLHFDKHSGHRQLIVVDLFDFHPNERQKTELRALADATPDADRGEQHQPIAFFPHDRLTKPPAQTRSNYEIAPTVHWILSPGKGVVA
jgi:hypothetical protein